MEPNNIVKNRKIIVEIAKKCMNFWCSLSFGFPIFWKTIWLETLQIHHRVRIYQWILICEIPILSIVYCTMCSIKHDQNNRETTHRQRLKISLNQIASVRCLFASPSIRSQEIFLVGPNTYRREQNFTHPISKALQWLA